MVAIKIIIEKTCISKHQYNRGRKLEELLKVQMNKANRDWEKFD